MSDIEAQKEAAAASPDRVLSPTPTLGPIISRKQTRGENKLQQDRGEVPIDLVSAMLEKTDAFRVTFDGPDDPRNAHNWSLRKKILQNVLITLATFWSGAASAVLSGASPQVAQHFRVGSVVAELANGMFVSTHPRGARKCHTASTHTSTDKSGTDNNRCSGSHSDRRSSAPSRRSWAASGR